MKHLLDMEKDFDVFFKTNDIEPINIYYENMIDNKQSTINLFLNIMGITKKFLYTEDKIHKISDEKNLQWKEQFENEEAGFLDETTYNYKYRLAL